MHSADRFLRWAGDKSENWNRRNAAIQSLIHSKADGLGLDQAVALAKNDITSIHGLYARYNRPLWIMKAGKLEPALAVLYMFQSWPTNALSQLIKVYASNSNKAKIIQTALMMGTAGAVGLPFMGATTTVGKWFDEGWDPEGSIRNGLTKLVENGLEGAGISKESAKWAGEHGADLMTYGLPGVAGVNASNMLGLGNVPWNDFSDVAGLYMSQPEKIRKTMKLVGQERYLRALETGMPSAQVARMLKAVRWMKDGVATDFSGEPLLRQDGSVFKPGVGDVVSAAVGAPRIDEIRHYEKQGTISGLLQAGRTKQALLYESLAQAAFEKDGDRFTKLLRKAVEWNKIGRAHV
jgi:hypothetical protein